MEEIQRTLEFEADTAKIQAAERYIFEMKLQKKQVLRKVLAPTFRALCRKRRVDSTGTKRIMLDRVVREILLLCASMRLLAEAIGIPVGLWALHLERRLANSPTPTPTSIPSTSGGFILDIT